MGLDFHVMPLWKYLAGEFQSPVERNLGIPVTRLGRPKAQHGAAEARKLGKGIRLWVEQEIGIEDGWDDDGEVMFSEQFRSEALSAVRAFAAHVEEVDNGTATSAQESFELTEPFEKHRALGRVLAGRDTSFPHLILHQDFYFPSDFEEPMLLMDGPASLGSSVRLLQELARLRRNLDEFPDWQSMKEGRQIEEPNPGIAWVKYGISFLYQACWISVQSRLPIIYDG